MEPLSTLTAIALGAMQGLTEFLPVSSSGHVAIVAWLFGIEDLPLSMVIAVHAGTLLSTLVVFGPELYRLVLGSIKGLGSIRGLSSIKGPDSVPEINSPSEFLMKEEPRVLLGVLLGSILTAAMGLLLKDQVESAAHVRGYVGIGLLVSAVVVLSTRWPRGKQKTLPFWGYVLIGVAQGIAIFPGITRSGSTIACGMALGLSGPAAFRFSFLLSLPAVFGAVLLELISGDGLSAITTAHVIAGVVAFVTGIVALLALRGIVDSGRFWWFAFYLVPVGIALLAWQFAG